MLIEFHNKRDESMGSGEEHQTEKKEDEQLKMVNLSNKQSITPLRLAVERERAQVSHAKYPNEFGCAWSTHSKAMMVKFSEDGF